MLILLQNILFTLVPWLFVLTVVVVVHELGHFLVAKAFGTKIDRFSIGFGKTLWARRDRSGVEWRVAALPLGGYVKFSGDADTFSSVPDAEDLADLKRQIVAKLGPQAVEGYYHFKPIHQRALIAAAGPLANFLLAIVIFAGFLMAWGEIVVTPRVAAVMPNSAAARAGFQPGDLVTSLNGRRIDNFLDVSQYAQFNAGRTTTFEVQRAGKPVTIVATPEAQTRPDPVFKQPMKLGVFGLLPPTDAGSYSRRRLSPVAAVAGGARETWQIISITGRYLGRMVTGQESGDQIGGPIRTALASKAITESGLAAGKTVDQKAEGVAVNLVGFIAMISIAIGFMNLLPIPMLDGGHLLFYGYEALARRPLSASVQAVGYRVGLALVVGLLLFATWNDLHLPVLKILGGHVS